jgi:hypothetical protein
MQVSKRRRNVPGHEQENQQPAPVNANLNAEEFAQLDTFSHTLTPFCTAI